MVIEELEKINKRWRVRMVKDMATGIYGTHTIAAKPTRWQKKALEVMERHLAAYKGVLSHSTWTGLRDDIAFLCEKRRVRKVK